MAHKQTRIHILLQSSLTSYFFPWRWDCCEYQRIPPEYNASLKPREMTFRIILHRCLTKISSSIWLEGENRLSFSSVLKFNSDIFYSSFGDHLTKMPHNSGFVYHVWVWVCQLRSAKGYKWDEWNGMEISGQGYFVWPIFWSLDSFVPLDGAYIDF